MPTRSGGAGECTWFFRTRRECYVRCGVWINLTEATITSAGLRPHRGANSSQAETQCGATRGIRIRLHHDSWAKLAVLASCFDTPTSTTCRFACFQTEFLSRGDVVVRP